MPGIRRRIVSVFARKGDVVGGMHHVGATKRDSEGWHNAVVKASKQRPGVEFNIVERDSVTVGFNKKFGEGHKGIDWKKKGKGENNV